MEVFTISTLYPKLVLIVEISKSQELIPQLLTLCISNHLASLCFFLTNVKISPLQELIPQKLVQN